MAAVKKKKRFYNVEMPLIRKTTQLQAYDISGLDGRYIKYDLTRILKGKSVLLTLKTKVDGEDVLTRPKELRLLPFYLKRVVRRGTNYIEDSFSTPAKDAQVRIKPFLITRRKVSRAVRANLRRKTNEELSLWAKERDIDSLFEEVLKGKIQKELAAKLKKIYPLALCEIRVLNVEEIKSN